MPIIKLPQDFGRVLKATEAILNDNTLFLLKEKTDILLYSRIGVDYYSNSNAGALKGVSLKRSSHSVLHVSDLV